MNHINDDNLIDYTDILPTFNHLFSGFYNNLEDIHFNQQMTNNQNILHDQMIDQHQMFGQHYEKIDK